LEKLISHQYWLSHILPLILKPGEEVFFNAAEPIDFDGYIASYNWSFGDGGKASGKEVSHK
jgi:hypothetical protein